jgi:hypothetical protein
MEVDRQLIFAARRLITGANVHRINTLIFQYEMAVRLSDDDKMLECRAKESEERLRQVVQNMRTSLRKAKWLELNRK